MARRILWLLNHTTLREFEVPMLVKMGYEVFCPKVYQHESGDLSASVTWEYDTTLTIPNAAVDKLNGADFYSGQLSQEVVDIMNRYFDIAIFGAFAAQVRMLVRNFRGILLFQAFGLEKTSSYTKVFYYHNKWLLKEIQACGQRFWFCAAYENLAEIENDFFKSRYIYLPIGLKKDTVSGAWTGGDEHILFVSPKILSNSYYNDIYKKFKKSFADIPHYIGGAQLIPVEDDPAVLGFVSRERFDYNMQHLAAMFYHSQEPRHLHYHPLEAVANGMPLVFMAGGMLDEVGGRELPGRCRTTQEAHSLLLRLSNGDKDLAQRIIQKQGVLLHSFSKEFCRKKWVDAFARIQEQPLQEQAIAKPTRIGVILPQPYVGGVLDYTLRLIRCISQAAEACGDDVSIVFGYPDDEVFRRKNYFTSLKDTSVVFRPFVWREKSAEWMREAHRLMGLPDDLPTRACVVAEDGSSHFADCDYLILTADRVPGHFFSTVPFAVVAHDYIQRYLPGLFGDTYEESFIDAVRSADAVFVTTPVTASDAVQYAGVPASKVYLAPLMFDLEDVPPDRAVKEERAYFLWPTNMNQHKNHMAALEALEAYYRKGGELACLISGVNTDVLNTEKDEDSFGARLTPYAKELRDLIQNNDLLAKNIVVKGNMPKEQYLQTLKHARFVFHPGYADNGNGAAVDGACLGVPTLSSDYPAMRYMDAYVGLHAKFFDPFDADSICAALLDMEKDRDACREKLPTREELRRFTVDGTCGEMYQVIKRAMGGLA